LIEPPDGVAALDTEIVVSAILTMPNLVHLEAAMWDWGDGSISSCAPDSADCTVEPEDGMQSTDFIVGRVAGSHTYSQPGFYAVHLTVRDIFGQFDTATFEYLVVYDPDGGFVTGGGWIDSPADWCPFSDELCHQAEGKSTFSFTAEYKQGATVPTGNTQFQLNAGDLSFHWGSYHWLVVDAGGSLAVLRGFGRLNGELSPDGDPYMFRLSVGDGSPDTFSVSIEDHYVHFGWYYDFEAEIWREGWHGHTDTVYRQPYGTLLPQPIGGSSIVVHAAEDK
jgi:hypothetical protein